MIKTWFPDDQNQEYYSAMANYSNDLYRVVRMYDSISGNDKTALQKVTFHGERVIIEEIDFAYGSVLPSSVYKLTSISSNEMLLYGDNNIYKITLDNHVTCELVADHEDYQIGGMATLFDGEETATTYVVSRESNTLKIIDPEDGTETGSLVLTLDVEETINYCTAMTAFNGRLLACANTSTGDQLIEINTSTGVCSIIADLSSQEIDLAVIDRNEEFELVMFVYNRNEYLFEKSLYTVEEPNEENPDLVLRFLYNFDPGKQDSDYNLAFNQDDGCLYHLAWRYCNSCPSVSEEEAPDVLTFEKINPYTLKTESIEISGFVQSDLQIQVSIDDGCNDMYDEGNFISTDVSSGSIPYTHTCNEEDDCGENFVLIADGEVRDGTNYFGEDSQYFTNMYAGLFVMAAYGININTFTIDGGLGADGSGDVIADIYTITVSDRHFKVYYKSVSEQSNDPSVNHLIIVEGNGAGITHTYSEDTDEDEHELTGLSGVDNIYYLLYGCRTGLGGEDEEVEGESFRPTEEEVIATATAFLTIAVTADTATELLTALNTGVTTITDEIPNCFHFCDFGETDISAGIDGDIYCFNYDTVSQNFYLLTSNGQLCSVTSSGLIRLVDDGEDYAIYTAVATVRRKIYAVSQFMNYFTQLSKINGNILNQDTNTGKPYDIATPVEGELNGFYGLASYGPELFGIANTSNGLQLVRTNSSYNFATINVGPFDDNFRSIASELVPSEKQIVGVTSTVLENHKTSTFYVIEHENAEIHDQIPLRHNWIEEQYVAQCYADGYLWRVVRFNEEEAGSITQFERVHINTKEREFIHVNNWEGFYESVPQSMIWTGDRFFYISDSKYYWIEKNGEHTADANVSGVTFTGLGYLQIDEEPRVLYGVTNDGKFYAINDTTGVPITAFFGEESDYLDIIVADWDINSVCSGFASSEEFKIIVFLHNHETLPSSWYNVTVNISTGTGTINWQEAGGNLRGLSLAPDGVYGHLLESQPDFNSVVHSGGMIYKINITDGSNLTPVARTAYREWLEDCVLAWDDINQQLYYATKAIDEFFEDEEEFIFGSINPHTGLREVNVIENMNEPKSMAFANNIFYVSNGSGMYTLVHGEGSWLPTELNTSVTQVSGMAVLGEVLYAVRDDETTLNTVDMETGLLTSLGNITVVGHTISHFNALVNFNGTLYAVMQDSDDSKHLISINHSTRVGTYIGVSPNFTTLAVAVCPKSTNNLEHSWFGEDPNGNILINSDEEIEIGNMEAEVYPYDFSHYHNPPEFGWKRVEVLGLVDPYDNGNWFISIDQPVGQYTVRTRYRNPNSAWSYSRWD